MDDKRRMEKGREEKKREERKREGNLDNVIRVLATIFFLFPYALYTPLHYTFF